MRCDFPAVHSPHGRGHGRECKSAAPGHAVAHARIGRQTPAGHPPGPHAQFPAQADLDPEVLYTGPARCHHDYMPSGQPRGSLAACMGVHGWHTAAWGRKVRAGASGRMRVCRRSRVCTWAWATSCACGDAGCVCGRCWVSARVGGTVNHASLCWMLAVSCVCGTLSVACGATCISGFKLPLYHIAAGATRAPRATRAG